MVISRRQMALRIAAEVDCDIRSAEKALEHGPRSVRGRVGRRIAAAMIALNYLKPSAQAAG